MEPWWNCTRGHRGASLAKPEAAVWRGDANLSDDQQSVRILGVPIGSAVLVRRQFEDKSVDQEMLFHRLQSVTTPTSGGVSEPFWDQSEIWTAPRLSPNCRSRVAAYWSSWADCIHMIKQRHPSVADTLITGIYCGPVPCFAPVRNCQGTLEEAGLEIPSWRTLADTPPEREVGGNLQNRR